ncbi:MAG: penicillin-binding protein 2 [Pseudomonadota bacterium]
MLFGAQLGVIAALGFRMRELQVEQADAFRLLAEENRVNIRLIPPARGLIYDRNSVPLALNRQNYRVTIVREQAGDVGAVLDKLAQLIPLPAERREKVLREVSQRSAFVPVVVTEHLTWDEIARVAANAPALPGVTPEVGLSRFYPEHATMAHVVGYVGPVSDHDLGRVEDPDPLLQIPDFQIGKTGVELRWERQLRGAAGNSRIEVNAMGRVMRELERSEGAAGQDVHLTIDRDLQAYALERMNGESAAAVVIDTETGDLLVSASSPTFDPNAFVFGISTRDWNALLNNDYRPLSNKAVSGAYPPGSTFKMVVALAALEAGLVGPEETVWCPGFLQVGDRRFHCWRRGGHGHINLSDSIKHSCDVYYYEIARKAGIERLTAMAKRLGLGVRPNLPLPAVTSGLTPTKDWKKQSYNEAWLVGDTLNAGIGQGYMLASPVQLAVMTARIASGRAVAPRLIRAVDGRPADAPDAPSIGLSPTHLTWVRQAMFDVVNTRRGTAYGSRIVDPAGHMAGKTGTSQVRIITKEERARGVYRNEDLPWERRDHALFVGYAPFDAPRYGVAVVVEHGGGGSRAAAPVARDIMMRCLYGPRPPLTAYPASERPEVERRRAEEPLAPPPPPRERA